jgi:formylmethanofuran dehydrogenase subunit C
MPLTVEIREAIQVAVDAAEISPDRLQRKSLDQIRQMEIRVGRDAVPLGDLANVSGNAADGEVRLAGSVESWNSVAWAMQCGRLIIDGTVGARLGVEMSGGRVRVSGSAGPWAGAAMRGGRLEIMQNAGDFLGAALPGEIRGVNGGEILVHGRVGREAGVRMRRGLIAVAGSAGAGLARGMIAGTMFVLGEVEGLAGIHMRRGTICLDHPDAVNSIAPSFGSSGRFEPLVLRLYRAHLREAGFPAASNSPDRLPERWRGDLALGGQGEILVA